MWMATVVSHVLYVQHTIKVELKLSQSKGYTTEMYRGMEPLWIGDWLDLRGVLDTVVVN